MGTRMAVSFFGGKISVISSLFSVVGCQTLVSRFSVYQTDKLITEN